MLRYSEVDATSAGGRSTVRLRVLGGRRNAVGPSSAGADGASDVMLASPARSIPQRDRRAVGRTVRWIGHALDAAALMGPLVVVSRVNNGAVPARIITLFVVVGTLLLWNTHRRGRLMVGPSEGLTTIVTRVGPRDRPHLVHHRPHPAGTPSESQSQRDHRHRSDRADPRVHGPADAAVPPRHASACPARPAGTGYDLEDTLIVGTGPVGVEVARALSENPEFGLVPCGFVDRFDDEHALPIVGRPEHLPEILAPTPVSATSCSPSARPARPSSSASSAGARR